jgi:hypothetical protein
LAAGWRECAPPDRPRCARRSTFAACAARVGIYGQFCNLEALSHRDGVLCVVLHTCGPSCRSAVGPSRIPSRPPRLCCFRARWDRLFGRFPRRCGAATLLRSTRSAAIELNIRMHSVRARAGAAAAAPPRPRLAATARDSLADPRAAGLERSVIERCPHHSILAVTVELACP